MYIEKVVGLRKQGRLGSGRIFLLSFDARFVDTMEEQNICDEQDGWCI